MAEFYCTFWSRESVRKLNGKNTCNGCDIRAIETVGYEGKMNPDDFPEKCPYCTDSFKAAHAATVAWKAGQAERECRHEEARLRAETHTS